MSAPPSPASTDVRGGSSPTPALVHGPRVGAGDAPRVLRPPQRLHQRLFLGRLPLSAIIVGELVVAMLLIARGVSARAAVAIVVAAVLVALVALVPLRGARLGSFLAAAVAFGFRRHVTSVRPEPGVDVPAEVRAFFPGLSVRQCDIHDGGVLGLVQWQGRWAATLAVTCPDTDILSSDGPVRLPVARLLRSLAGQDLRLESLQITTQTLGGQYQRWGDGALATVATELALAGALVRDRTVYLTVVVNPLTAAAALAVRGGGFTGLQRLLSAAVGRIRAELLGAGLAAEPLDAAAAVRAMASSLLQPPARTDPRTDPRSGPRADPRAGASASTGAETHWIESWKQIASAQLQHRCFVVSSWGTSATDALAGLSCYGVTTSHVIRRDADSEPFRVLSVVRLSAPTGPQLDAASRELRKTCRRIGVGVRLLRGRQAEALRITIPAGRH